MSTQEVNKDDPTEPDFEWLSLEEHPLPSHGVGRNAWCKFKCVCGEEGFVPYFGVHKLTCAYCGRFRLYGLAPYKAPGRPSEEGLEVNAPLAPPPKL